MASKAEELRQFNKLKKAFAGAECTLSCNYESWAKQPEYRAYVNIKDEDIAYSNINEAFKTPQEAVDDVIKYVKEVRKEKEEIELEEVND